MGVSTIVGGNVRNSLFRVTDLASVIVAFCLTALIASELAREGMFIWPAPSASDILGWPAQYVVLLLIAALARSAVASSYGYHAARDDSLHSPVSYAWKVALLWAAAIGVCIFLFKLSNISRVFVLSFILLGSVLALLCGKLEGLLLARLLDKQRVALVIGSGSESDWLIGYLRGEFCPQPYARVERLKLDELASVGGVETPPQAERKGAPAPKACCVEVFVVGADMSEDPRAALPVLLKRGATIHLLPAVFDASIFRLALNDISGVPLVTIQGAELDPIQAGIKRVIDFAGALLALTIGAPLMAALAVLVKVSSPGPALFQQARLGRNGKTIYIYKFRTMRSDAEAILKSDKRLYSEYVRNNYKLPKGKDPRVTWIGRVLRELSLDELPQLINVLKGEMSLVGPRPVVPDEIQRYGDWAEMVLSVQPGLTGQWQVSGRSDIADYAERVQLDIEYLRDQSVAMDLRILAKTVPVVLLRQGAH